MTESYTNKIFA